MSNRVTDLDGLSKRLLRDGFDPGLVSIADVHMSSMPHWFQTGVFLGGELVAVYGQRRDGKIVSQIRYASDLAKWSRLVHRNPRIGSMMEGFSDLLNRPKVDMTLGRVDVELAYRDEDGDLTLDILRLKKGRAYAAAAAGELGRLPSSGLLFKEHNTYVKPKYRGQGLMLGLYKELLLQDGSCIISDEWNHSEPMRRVWMKLSETPGVFVFSVGDQEKHSAKGQDFGWKGFDEILIAVTAEDMDSAKYRVDQVLSELGTDWSSYAMEDMYRFSDDGGSSDF